MILIESIKRHKVIFISSALVCIIVPSIAWADPLSILDALGKGPEAFICTLLISVIFSFMNDVLAPLMNSMFDWGLDWASIPYVNKIIMWLQALSVVAVIVIRIAVGINKGLLRQGDFTSPFSKGEFAYKSFVALIVVAIMPTLCRLVIVFGKSMYDSIVDIGGSADSAMSWFSLDGLESTRILDASTYNVLWFVLLVLLILILTIACGYQFVRRQIEMLTVMIIAPVVAVYQATENDSNQVGDLLRSLFGLVSQQWIQYILVMVAIGFAQSWMLTATAAFSVQDAKVFSTSNEVVQFMFCIASYAAALTIPRLVDRYTYASGGTHIGGLVLSNLLRGFGTRRISGK